MVGTLGRVVPIKDVATFIRAMRSVCDQMHEAEGWIVGPSTEDEDYRRECEELVRNLGLEGRVRLLGLRSPESILPQLGVLVLTSISEALPLVILEAFASGLPVVATDVGACRELVEGRTPEDRTGAGPDHHAHRLSGRDGTGGDATSLRRASMACGTSRRHSAGRAIFQPASHARCVSRDLRGSGLVAGIGFESGDASFVVRASSTTFAHTDTQGSSAPGPGCSR